MNIRLFSVIFFLSGLCGLMYQILWTRLFSFVLGNTYLAISIIVASFMFGLFFGSYLVGRWISRLRNELRWYAFLEIAIGLYALLLLFAFAVPEALFKGLYLLFGGVEILHSGAKFLLTLILLVVPTGAMGATLPLAVQYYTKRKKLFGDNISLFYAVNTVGGAIGVLIAGFYLIERLGIHMGLVATACLNIVLGVGVLLGRPQPVVTTEEASGVQARKEEKPKKKKKKKREKRKASGVQLSKEFYLAAAGLAGFAALSYEIIWTRGLKFLIHNSTYSFSVMLFVFLLGIAIGSNVAKRIIARRQDLHYIYGFLQTLLGLYAIFTIYLMYDFSYSSFFQNNVIEIIYDYSYSWLWGILIYCLVCVIVFLFPTVLMGILFPLVNELFYRSSGSSGKTTSSIYAINTIGGILGSLAAGFLLLPLFGIKTSLILVSVINLAIGIWFVIKSQLRIAPTLTGALALFIFVTVLSTDVRYLYGRAEEKTDHVLFYEEGLMATVKVYSRGRNLFMSIDGNVIASTHQTLFKKEKLIAHLPFLVKQDIRDVLAVGLASGISVGSMSLYEHVEQIDCVELIKPVFPAARYFDQYNFDIYNNEKIDLIHNDIYAQMMYHPKKYDLISSDGKLGTLYSGNTIMLSKDFYDLSKLRLNEGGLFIQWLPIITPHDEMKIIFETLATSFEHVALFYFFPTDIMMLASDSPIVLDKAHIDDVLARPAIQQELRRFKLTNTTTLLTSFAGPYVPAPDEEIKINSFDRPYLEFSYMREWKESREYEGGYRAKNTTYLLENHQRMDLNALNDFTANIEADELQMTKRGAELFLEGCIHFFKTGNFQESFREYLDFTAGQSS